MSYYRNRTLCDVLEEMRKLDATKNYSGLLGLVEEAQSYGNRMEAGLHDQKDLIKMREEWSQLKNKINVLKKEHKALGGKDEDEQR